MLMVRYNSLAFVERGFHEKLRLLHYYLTPYHATELNQLPVRFFVITSYNAHFIAFALQVVYKTL